jgi:hypothetical protein
MAVSFKHSGDLGDIIFSIPAIQALGQGQASLYLSRAPGFTREDMTEERFNFLLPLLCCQKGLQRVERYRGQAVLYDLDEFRRHWFKLTKNNDSGNGVTIADWHCRAFGVDSKVTQEPWLQVPGWTQRYQVVINRTDRYHGRFFDWKKVVDKYKRQAVFIGLPKEHEQFVAEFGYIPYKPVADALEMAQIIYGCQLFIGNQSLPEAIAEGFKKDKILEVPVLPPTSLYPRPNAQYVTTSSMWLPDL